MKADAALLAELTFIRQALYAIEQNGIAMGDWLNRKTVLRFFDYGDTQLRALERKGGVRTAKIGRRKFYSKASIIQLLNNSQIQ